MNAATRVVPIPLQFERPGRFVEDLAIGPQKGLFQDLRRQGIRPGGGPTRFEIGLQDIDGHGAGHVSGGMTADPVGNGQEHAAAVVRSETGHRHAEKTIFIE